MTFVDIPAAAAIFFDANVFVYHFEPHAIYGAACTDLLERVEHQQLTGFTSTHVLSEVAHRLMAIEAMKAFGWTQAGIAVRLRNHPAQVQTLQQFRVALQEIPRYSIQLFDTALALIDVAAGISQQTGLLHNDALMIAVMRHHGLTNIASEDTDFDRVPGLTRYSPV